MESLVTDTLLTVEQAAVALKVHAKTVLRYIREGRLPAHRIGKAYRIQRSRLDAFAGMAAESARPANEVRTTVIVEIGAISADRAERMASFVGAAALSDPDGRGAIHVSTAFDPIVGALKIVLVASPSEAARLLELVQLQLDLPR